MSDDLVLDERLPALVGIEEPNRQQMRRITRTATRCSKCLEPLTAENLCFADGRDAHRSCAELWNFELLNGWDELKAQDAAEHDQIRASAKSMGLALPKGSALWTPATKPAPTPAVVGAQA